MTTWTPHPVGDDIDLVDVDDVRRAHVEQILARYRKFAQIAAERAVERASIAPLDHRGGRQDAEREQDVPRGFVQIGVDENEPPRGRRARLAVRRRRLRLEW
jgi:hypothetical protein